MAADNFWHALLEGENGIRPIDLFDTHGLTVRFGGQVPSFDPKLYVRPRKSLKVMSRDIQFGFAAADLAMADAGIASERLDPERFGVVFGNDMIYADLDDLETTYRRAKTAAGTFSYDQWSDAIQEELQPLWLLKHLPNMTASHIAIAQDARGPNNTIVLGDVSCLLAVSEAATVILRGWADIMLAGGTGVDYTQQHWLPEEMRRSQSGTMTLNQHAGPLTCIEMGLSMERVLPFLFSNQENTLRSEVRRFVVEFLRQLHAVNRENKRTSRLAVVLKWH